jgi:3',5'-cyclic AMP phosphodiesterase CpdA
VLLTGDFTSTSTDEEFALAVHFVRGLKARGLAVHLIPGNHDVYTFESVRARRFERHFGEFLPAEGFPARVILPGGTPLILVPTVRPRAISTRGFIASRDIKRVADLLGDCGPSAIVAAHYPVLHQTHGYASNWCRRMENADALRSALGDSGKRILYVCGHVHRFSYEHDTEHADLEHLSTGAFLRTDRANGSQGEFTVIKTFANAFRVYRHVHTDAWTATAVAPLPPSI